jgi:hypothetical protein
MDDIDRSTGSELLDGPAWMAWSRLSGKIFLTRLDLFWQDMLRPLRQLYPADVRLATGCGSFCTLSPRAYAARPEALRLLDLRREAEPDWFQQAGMIGYVTYVDRFAGDLAGCPSVSTISRSWRYLPPPHAAAAAAP